MEDSMQRASGRVLVNMKHRGYTIIRSGKQCFFAHYNDYVHLDDGRDIQPGMPVSFSHDPGSPVAKGKNPVAVLIEIQKIN